MKTVSVRDIQTIDRMAIERVGIPSMVLMENAGRAVADEAAVLLRRHAGRRVCVVCGTGNNGGDGLVAARHLVEQHFSVGIIMIGQQQDLKPDSIQQYHILKALNISAQHVTRLTPSVKQMIAGADVVIDAIFGVGLSREISGPFRLFIETINASRAKVISADVPSGLDADTGKVLGCCIEANVTVTFTRPKKSFSRVSVKKYVGRVKVVDIGIPEKIVRRYA